MGRVYVAEHVRMGRKSAVKVMSPNLALSADAITRFNREAANASRINHPNVAQIYDFGETASGMLYLAMELVEGETLRVIIERDGPLALERAANLTSQIADALAAAHHIGIVHRDLKPDNVMIARHHDGSDWVKVVDFGIAKTVQGSGESGGSQTVTTAGVSLGTPEYMSPEQLAGEKLDARTDLYSLGLVLFNMLTADLPYARVTSKETLVKRLVSKPQALCEVAPGRSWSPALQAALDRALAPEASDRYESVVDFARDVTAATTNVKTVRLSAPTQRIAIEPVAKPKTKTPLVVTLAAIAAVGAGGGALLAKATRHPNPPPVPPVVQVAQQAAPLPKADSVAPKPAAAAAKPSFDTATMSTTHKPAVPANASDADRVQYIVNEIRSHFSRAQSYLQQAAVQRTRSEIRDVGGDVRMLRELYPAAAESLHVQQLVTAGAMRLVQQACPAALADTTKHFPANFRCDLLLPNFARPRGAGRQGRAGRPFSR